jgi:S1-C subfamily serine protease
MFCKYCGQENTNDAKFCKNCGRKIKISKFSRINQCFKKHWKGITGILGAIIILTIIASFSNNSPSSKQQNIPPEESVDTYILTQKDVVASVVNIVCSTYYGKEISGGSGIIIEEEGGILTNYHVVADAEVCLITLPNIISGTPEEIYVATPLIVPQLSKQYDLAFLKITEAFIDDRGKAHGIFPKKFKTFTESPFCSGYVPKLGDEIRIYGYPVTSGGYNLTITDGVISSFSSDGLILTSAKVDSGNSGGLAITKDGCLVGIPSAIFTGKYQNLGVIIPSTIILEFANQIK